MSLAGIQSSLQGVSGRFKGVREGWIGYSPWKKPIKSAYSAATHARFLRHPWRTPVRSPKLHTSESPGISLRETVTSRSMARQEATVEGSPCLFLSAATISISIICCLDNGGQRGNCRRSRRIFFPATIRLTVAGSRPDALTRLRTIAGKLSTRSCCSINSSSLIRSVRSSFLSLFPGIHISTGKHPVYQDRYPSAKKS